MITSRWVTRGLLAAVVVVGSAATVRSGEGREGEDGTAGVVPRYRLKVGQELKYHGTSDFKYDGGSLGNEMDWQVRVVRANKDGGWRLVLRLSNRRTQVVGGRNIANGPADTSLAYFDMTPDGRVVANDSLGYSVDPGSLFPRLPDDASQATRGWQSQGLRFDERTEFTPTSAADGKNGSNCFAFEGVRKSPSDRIYLSTARSTYTFDRKRGLVSRIESANTQGYGFNGKGTGTVELTGVEDHDADSTRAFADDADRYFAANKAFEERLGHASRDAGRVNAVLSQAESELKAVRDKLTVPVFRDQADHQLYKLKGMTSYYQEEAQNRAAVLGHDAADWQTTDLDGKPHALKDYRGKVVVLDF